MVTIRKKNNLYLLHGLMGTGIHHFQPQVEVLQKKYNVIPVDLPGHGNNVQEVSDPFFEPTLEWLVNEIKTHGAGFIIGLSMGASLAMHLGLRYPELVQGLILTGYTPEIPKNMKNVMEKQYKYFQSLELNNPELAEVYRSLHGNRWSDTLESVVKNFTFNYPSVSESLIKKLEVQTFLINGDLEEYESNTASRLPLLNPNIKSEILPNCGHVANLEQPALFNEKVLAFLDLINIDRLYIR